MKSFFKQISIISFLSLSTICSSQEKKSIAQNSKNNFINDVAAILYATTIAGVGYSLPALSEATVSFKENPYDANEQCYCCLRCCITSCACIPAVIGYTCRKNLSNRSSLNPDRSFISNQPTLKIKKQS